MSDSESEEPKSVYNALTRPVPLSEELCDFLQVSHDTMLSRASVNRAITAYIFVNDKPFDPETMDPTAFVEKKMWADKLNPHRHDLRDVHDKRVIRPDVKLSTLLGYEDYRKRVANGEVKWKRRDRETGECRDIVELYDTLTYAILQHLLAKHYKPQRDKITFLSQ